MPLDLPENDDNTLGDEIEVTFEPRAEDLEKHGISPEAFEAALLDALETHQELLVRGDLDENAIPTLENLVLDIDGRSFKVTDLADCEIGDHDPDQLDDEDEDDDNDDAETD